MFFRARRYSSGAPAQSKTSTNSTAEVTLSSPSKYYRNVRSNYISSARSSSNSSNGNSSSGGVSDDMGMVTQPVSGGGSTQGISSQLHSLSSPSSPNRTESARPSSSAGTPSSPQQEVRFRYERPNSAPIKSVTTKPSQRFPSFSEVTSQFPSAPSTNLSKSLSPSTGRRNSLKSPHISQSSGSLGDNENLSSDLTFVEQRLKIIKRNRADRTIFSTPSSLSSPSNAGDSSSPNNQGALRLLKHEQHVVDVMITQCLDVLLFPSVMPTTSIK